MLPKINPLETKAWAALEDHFEDISNQRIVDLFEKDPDRFNQYSVTWNDDRDWVFRVSAPDRSDSFGVTYRFGDFRVTPRLSIRDLQQLPIHIQLKLSSGWRERHTKLF